MGTSLTRGRAPQARGRPRSERLDATILDSCFTLLSEVGYARLSIDAVARRAGVTRPTVYRRWASKEDVVVAALERAQSGIADIPVSGDVVVDLTAQLASLCQTLSRPGGMALIGTMLAEESSTPALLDGFRVRVVGARRAPIKAVLQHGIPALSAADADLLVDFAVGAFYARYVAGGRFTRRWPRRTAEAVITCARAVATGAGES